MSDLVDSKGLLEGITPGPWLGGSTIRAAGMGERVGKVAEVAIAFKDSAMRDANARLIAAAPQLAKEHALLVEENARLRARGMDELLGLLRSLRPAQPSGKADNRLNKAITVVSDELRAALKGAS